ncbi:MAG: HlyD family secretion protein [Roseiarcus sp.]|uniref:HlyD family efflux transporter periplasmic adaptor subunit n=1 Tax=Roseiarcus sp. TaxID=1969460 RepID=UPI003C51E8E5
MTPSKSAVAREAAHPASDPPQGSGQPVQFTPARPAPGPGPQPVPLLPAAPPPAPAPAAPPITVKGKRSGPTRTIVLFVVPLLALALGFAWWLHSGRYVTTDNAYVGSDKVLITPQVTGAIVAVHVLEGQKVKVGDPLFDIDPQPYEIALRLAQGRLDAAKVEFANLRSSYVSNQDQIKMGQDAVNVRQADFDRKNALASHGSGTTADRDTSMAALIQARQILEFVNQQQATTMVKLGGSLDAPIENFPDYIQARAGLEDAQRNLRNTKIQAPIDGVATQVAQIELGRVAPAGQPVFAVVADTGLWVDANPKESDMTFVREGMPATVTVDAFPDKVWSGTICSIAPGTGAQFAILPPQNASGNWVKVVQRVPLRFCFGPNEDTANVRSGMSANLSIDTGRVRTLAGVLSDLKGWAAGFVPGFASAKNVPA